MKSKRLGNSVKLIIIILILSVAVFVGYYIKNKQNPLFELVNNLKSNSLFNDNINGVYLYNEVVGGNRAIFSSCSVNDINNYILIINDEYKVFRSSCMGTYLKDEGKVDDLNITENKEEIYIEYNGHKYEKEYAVSAIIPNNVIASRLKTVEIANLQFIMEETEFEGNYYPIEARLSNNTSTAVLFDKNQEEDAQDTITLINAKSKAELYKYSFEKYDELPFFRPFGKLLVIIEKKDNPNNNMKYGYKFYVLNEQEIEYNLDQMFPITVNGETLTVEDNSVYVMFDEKERSFKLFVGYNKKMCNEEGSEHRPIYYEFKINYNYTTMNFEKPEFIKVGYEDEKCNYIRNYVDGG